MIFYYCLAIFFEKIRIMHCRRHIFDEERARRAQTDIPFGIAVGFLRITSITSLKGSNQEIQNF